MNIRLKMTSVVILCMIENNNVYDSLSCMTETKKFYQWFYWKYDRISNTQVED